MSHLNGPNGWGHIAVACALGYVDFRHDARGTGAQATMQLGDWYAGFAERDAMRATNRPPGKRAN